MTGPLRALVVDDDVAIRLLVTRILERRHFLVDIAGDGAEGIERLASKFYDVVVLDLMMPRVDGAGVLKYLREHLPEQLPSVIVMTAFGANVAERLTPPPARFLAKPFEVAALVNEVTECLRTSRPPDPPE